jgi:hypothetical protein
MVRRSRAGRSTLGCLFGLLVLVTAAYFAVGFGEPYWRFYDYRDAMQQEARFAQRTSDAEIIARLQAKADSIGLPEDAQKVRIHRTRDSIAIWSAYTETVTLPLFTRAIEFMPKVERSF